MTDRFVYPSVFVVDGQADTIPFVPPRKRKKDRQFLYPLLLFLVIVALGGVLVEGYFLREMYSRLESTTLEISTGVNASFEKLIQERKIDPEKPAAHFIGCNCSPSDGDLLFWDDRKGLAFKSQTGYRDGALLIKKTGYYFVYSKIFLGEVACNGGQRKLFKHSIVKKSDRYPNDITMMSALRLYCSKSSTEQWLENSFLGGLFYLDEGDHISVKVKEKQLVRIKDGTMSYFGAYML